MKSKRQAIREKNRKRKLYSSIMWGGVLIAVIGVLGYALWVAFLPAYGETIPVMTEVGHMNEGDDPGPYNSDPPTSGPHYANDFEAGFYDETDLANLPKYPEGYLVHNLEHGYVIFWYNCNSLNEQGCLQLKDQIRSVMDQFGGVKLIAFPWDSLDVPVVMTSWGRMQRFETFNVDFAKSFVERNRNRAPEPNTQ